MSTADSIIEIWNRSFRAWSENYIKPFKSAILRNCEFPNDELHKGHSSALRDIEKNKGNISQFVYENTEQKYSNMLPSKILSDTYSFMANHKNEYKMVYRSVLSSFISWKPGTTNALSKEALRVHYGDEHFACKFRKYQLESMKKFIQATPGTKEIRGQWAANLANDSMMVSFGNNNEVILLLKIGCFIDKLHIMYEENGVLRKNSKIRKQTLKTSCWGLEKTQKSLKFDNSVIIQENYGIDLFADSILNISPIIVYVCKKRINRLYVNKLRINNSIINLNKRPFHIRKILIPSLTNKEQQLLRLKYGNTLLNKGCTKAGIKKSIKKNKSIIIKKENKHKYNTNNTKNENSTDESTECDQDSDFNPVKPKKMDTDDDENDNDDNDDNGFYPIKKHHKKYLNDSTSLISMDPIKEPKTMGKDLQSFTTNSYQFTPQEPIAMYDANMDFNTNTFDSQSQSHPHPNINMPPITNFNDDPLNWDIDQFATPITRFPSISSINSINNDFPNHFEFNDPNYPLNDMDLDLHHNYNNNHNHNHNHNLFPLPLPQTPYIDHSHIGVPFVNHNNNPHNYANNNNMNEMQQLRQQNELLLRRVADQQRQIEFLATQIGTVRSEHYAYYPGPYRRNPLKRRRISSDALLPPAA